MLRWLQATGFMCAWTAAVVGIFHKGMVATLLTRELSVTGVLCVLIALLLSISPLPALLAWAANRDEPSTT